MRTVGQPGIEIVDLHGKAVIPGLVDSHAHMDREGLKDIYPSLAGAKSIDDVLARIADLVKTTPPGEWIVTMPIGQPPSYWNVPESLTERRWPTRHDLDRVAPNNPVYIRPIWGFWRHKLPLVSVANTCALERYGITRDTLPPAPSVVIEKDASGDLTGVFTEWTDMSIVELTMMRGVGSLPMRIASAHSSARCRLTTASAPPPCSKSTACPARCWRPTGRCASRGRYPSAPIRCSARRGAQSPASRPRPCSAPGGRGLGAAASAMSTCAPADFT